MRRCVIIPAWAPDGIRSVVDLKPDDFIICADRGYVLAIQEGIEPDLLVGDFDSLNKPLYDLPIKCRIIQAACEKNETDTLLCLQYGIEAGYTSFVLAGGIGGRLDHTMANVQVLVYALYHGVDLWMVDKCNRISAMGPGEKRIPRTEGFKLSVLAYAAKCEGVTLKNVKYPLENAILTSDFPLGISNEFAGPEAVITLKHGCLLILLSCDP